MFVYYNNYLVNVNNIKLIDCSEYLEKGTVIVYLNNGTSDFVNDPDALNLIMKLAPSWFEGKRGKYAKRAWLLHNMIGHPGMQLCYLLWLPKLGMWLHDITVPKCRKY